MKGPLALLVATALLLAADNPKADDAKKELDKWQGAWNAVSGENNGEKVADDDIKGVTFVVKGDKWALQKDGEDRIKGSIKLNPAKKPKEFDAETDNGDTVVGIYEIKGDELKVCWSDSERPKEFATKADSNAHLSIYKKGKAK